MHGLVPFFIDGDGSRWLVVWMEVLDGGVVALLQKSRAEGGQ